MPGNHVVLGSLHQYLLCHLIIQPQDLRVFERIVRLLFQLPCGDLRRCRGDHSCCVVRLAPVRLDDIVPDLVREPPVFFSPLIVGVAVVLAELPVAELILLDGRIVLLHQSSDLPVFQLIVLQRRPLFRRPCELRRGGEDRHTAGTHQDRGTHGCRRRAYCLHSL